jgi:hypothetical protein
MPFNPQLALSESGEVNVVWNSEKINATSPLGTATQQNITSDVNTTNIQPTIILKKVESTANATLALNNTTEEPSSSATVLPTLNFSAPSANANPIVNAGQDQFVRLNETGQQALTITLNGSAIDPDNDPLVYRWNQIGGNLANLGSLALPQTQISIPIATLANGNNTFTFELAAYDNKNGIGKDKTTIQILRNDSSSLPRDSTQSTLTETGGQSVPGMVQQSPSSTGNKPPNADARASPSVANSGQQVSLLATASNDEDGTISAFSWEQLGGETVTLLGKDKSIATFNAPNEETILEFRLTVVDNQGQTDNATVQVSVRGAEARGNTGDSDSSESPESD